LIVEVEQYKCKWCGERVAHLSKHEETCTKRPRPSPALDMRRHAPKKPVSPQEHARRASVRADGKWCWGSARVPRRPSKSANRLTIPIEIQSPMLEWVDTRGTNRSAVVVHMIEEFFAARPPPEENPTTRIMSVSMPPTLVYRIDTEHGRYGFPTRSAFIRAAIAFARDRRGRQ
jgi:hypothetical protein